MTLEVCSEENLYQIMMRYLPHNSHLMSYTWRYMGRGLCLTKTLEENGIPDEREIFNDVGLPENLHIPAILIYYNDDLTQGNYGFLLTSLWNFTNSQTRNILDGKTGTKFDINT